MNKQGAKRSLGERTLLAYTMGVYVFLFAPILILAVFSFNASKSTATWAGFTLDWYWKAFKNEQIQAALLNSLEVAGATTLIATLVGTPAGIALGRYAFRGRRPTQTLLYLPLIIPEIVLGAAMLSFFGLVGMRLGFWTVVIAHVVFCLSYVAIIVRARVAGMDRSVEEAAADLGAPPWAVFFRVTLPAILPAVLAGALLVFTISLDDYLVTSFVAGVGSTTLPLKIYSMLKVGVTPEINAVSTLLLAFTVVLIVPAQWLLQRDARQRNSQSKK